MKKIMEVEETSVDKIKTRRLLWFGQMIIKNDKVEESDGRFRKRKGSERVLQVPGWLSAMHPRELQGRQEEAMENLERETVSCNKPAEEIEINW